RYDQKSRRDADGRIFLDVNSVCFQAIVDYLNELAITPDGVSTSPPTVEADLGHILNHQLELFGLNEKFIGSAIMKDGDNIAQLREWISKAGSGITIIETTEGHIVGGYSSAPWTSSASSNSRSNGAFLFHLSGSQLLKSNLIGRRDSNAIYRSISYGPTFGGGHDLRVDNPFIVTSNFGASYQTSASWPLSEGVFFQVKEMEVFQITSTSVSANKRSATSKASPVSKVDSFSKKMNEAINSKWESLAVAEDELVDLEASFEDEGKFISDFAAGAADDVITLNVSGTRIKASLHTLQLVKDSALAKLVSDATANKATVTKPVKDWNYEDVTAWLNRVEGIPDPVVKEFEDQQVTGRELISLGVEGLKDFGVVRKGTIYLLLKEIKTLEETGGGAEVLIEQSPYCVNLIVDHLRLESAFMKDLVARKHPAPVVCESEKERFHKVVKHFFPGQGSEIFE
ncbi:hypothetical protein THAOC_06252, partial [Thalassiosira oceanica]